MRGQKKNRWTCFAPSVRFTTCRFSPLSSSGLFTAIYIRNKGILNRDVRYPFFVLCKWQVFIGVEGDTTRWSKRLYTPYRKASKPVQLIKLSWTILLLLSNMFHLIVSESRVEKKKTSALILQRVLLYIAQRYCRVKAKWRTLVILTSRLFSKAKPIRLSNGIFINSSGLVLQII